MLLLSNTPPLQAVGLTVSIGAGFCLVLGAIFSSAAMGDGALSVKIKEKVQRTRFRVQ